MARQNSLINTSIRINRNKLVISLAAALLLALFLVWQSRIFVEYHITDAKVTTDFLTIKSRPGYDWLRLSEDRPYCSLNFCRDMIFIVPRLERDKKAIIKINNIKFKSLITGDEVLPKTNSISLEYMERTDNFAGHVYFPAICHLPEWRAFVINLEVTVEVDGRQYSKTIQFKHRMTRNKSYGLYFLDVISSA